jgi:glycopeptide antibiotics resistance protein
MVPFRIFIEAYIEAFTNGNINYFIINFLGNIIMFMPIGFFIPLLWDITPKKTILIGACFSASVEIIQLFLARGTDIDDLMLNTFGVLLGVIVFKILNRNNKLEKFKVMKTTREETNEEKNIIL